MSHNHESFFVLGRILRSPVAKFHHRDQNVAENEKRLSWPYDLFKQIAAKTFQQKKTFFFQRNIKNLTDFFETRLFFEKYQKTAENVENWTLGYFRPSCSSKLTGGSGTK